MEGDGRRELGRAQFVATLIYVVPLVVFPIVGRMVKVNATVDAESLRVLALVLGVGGVADYGISLFLEQRMLARGETDGTKAASAVFSTAAVVASFGASLAVYGLVLTLLGAPGWGAALYVLCAAHGLHLVIRWPRYARAAEGAPYR